MPTKALFRIFCHEIGVIPRAVLFTVLLTSLSTGSSMSIDHPAEFRDTLKAIGQDLQALRVDFPQFGEFSVDRNVDVENLTISYAYHTHRPAQTGGWTSGVPSPDDDGIWLHFDIHNPASRAEIHNQPLTAPMCLGHWRVSYLALHGATTRSAEAAIWKILRQHGVTECGH